MKIFDIHFLNPIFIYIIPVVIIIFLFVAYLWARKNKIEIGFYDDLKKIYPFLSLFSYIKLVLIGLIIISFFALFANPHKVDVDEQIKKNGIDIVIALDVSKSMESEDLKPTRIEAAKKVIYNFLDKFETDRVGLVIFAWRPFSSVPMTFDYDILKENIDLLTTDSLNQNINWFNWTAIWDALLLSKNLFRADLEENKKREKVVILLTDWDANRWVEPELAAKVLKEESIKIYSIWIWSEEWWYVTYKIWPFAQRENIPPLDEKTLRKISNITSWEFFRASDNKSLESIFKYLEKLEKNDIEVKIKKNFITYYEIFLYIILILLTMLILLEFYIFRR